VIARPEGGVLGGVVEALAVIGAGGHAVVIAADVELRAVHLAHDIEDLVRLRAVADEVAEADDLLVLLAADAVHHRAQGLDVRVEIADDEGPHAPILARTLFGSSRRRRSTISAIVSSSRTSRATSAIR